MYLPIGTIISGTCKTEDRFPELLCVVSDCDLENEDLGRTIALFTERWDNCEGDDEAGDYLFEELCELAEGYLAPYTYLGCLEGDGADFGVWPNFDSLEESSCDGPVATEFDGEVLRVGWIPSYLSEVSDHGNVTLYKVTVEKVWSTV